MSSSGPSQAGQGALKRTVITILSIVLWPVAQLLFVARIRFLVGGNVLARIGHTALAPDVYVKAALLGLRRAHRGVLLAPRGSAINPCLLHYWNRYFIVIDQPLLVMLLRIFERMPRLQYDLGFLMLPDRGAVKIIPAIYPVQRRYEAAFGEQPLLQLLEADRLRGRRRLQELGVPDGAWFVCLHVREQGHLPHLAYHSYRNSDIMTYLPAVEAIVERGGWVIRMGDSSMTPLPAIRHVVDYVHSGLQTDWMDIVCFATCRWLLGDTSGPFVVSFVFGVPCATVNFISIGHAPFSVRDLWIPKRLRSVREDRDLSFVEVLHSKLRAFSRTDEYEAAGVAWVNSAPEEIREVAVEMMDRLDGCAAYQSDDERFQQEFKSLLAADPVWGTSARVGRDFLRRHSRLLEGDAIPKSESELLNVVP